MKDEIAFFWIALAKLAFVMAVGCVLARAFAQAPKIDLPKDKPITATGVAICQDHHTVLLVMVVTYKNGKVVRISSKNMHGLESAEQVVQYGQLAGEGFMGIDMPCEGEVQT